MTLVDSSVWIDFFNGVDSAPAETLDRLLGAERVVIGDLILTEVLQGFGQDRDFRTALFLLGSLECAPLLGPEMAVESARNYRRLRKKGATPRKTIDVIIASWCISHRMPLLFSDRDFEPFVTHLGLIRA